MNERNRDQRQLVLCFQVHQPRRLKKIEPAAESATTNWIDEELDRRIMERVANSCYLPMNQLLLTLIRHYPQLKVTFSISGLALEQMEAYTPEVLESFKALAATRSVDFMAETYYHSMAFLMESEEFEIQILEQTEKIVELFGIHPWAFRNAHLLYNDDIGRRVNMLGFQGLLTEGNESVLQTNNPHFLYQHRDQNGLKLFLRNPRLSNDIAFHVVRPEWNLTAERYMGWLESIPGDENLIAIALDYETFGEHHKEETGITDFIEHLLLLLAMQNEIRMITPSEILQTNHPTKPLSVPDFVAVTGCDISQWLGNDKQREAFSAMISLEPLLKDRDDPKLLRQWRYLQSSDHFFYMSDQVDGGNRFSPYSSSQEAFEKYMSVVDALSNKVQERKSPTTDVEKLNEVHEAERRNLNAPVWAMTIDHRHPTTEH